MSQTVLITGGTGLIGRRLTHFLLTEGYKVSYLSRQYSQIPNVKVYRWDTAKGILDEEALEQADYLVHLAGAGIADQRWSAARKQEIINSRTQGIELIARILQSRPYQLKSFVSASGIGYYGGDTGNTPLTEDTPSGSDYIAHVARHWENAAELIDNVGIRTTKLRLGVVLSHEGGALPKIAAPVRYGVGAPLGNGQQWLSWIHIDDVCRLMIESLNNPNFSGVYNAVAPNPVTNEAFTRHIAEILHRPLWLPSVPSLALKLIFGEMATVVTGSNLVLNERIAQETDFVYQFTLVENALEDLLNK